MNDVFDRRAQFVYEAARLAAIAAQAPVIPASWNDREPEFRNQFVRVIERQCSPQRSGSPEELHGSWMQAYYEMGWQYDETYDREQCRHPDLVPYSQLGQLERDKDSVFVLLCEIARQFIYEPVTLDDAPNDDGSPDERTPSIDAQRRDALRR